MKVSTLASPLTTCRKTSLDSIIVRAIYLHQHGWGNIEPRCHTFIVSSRDGGRTIGTRPVTMFYAENRRSQAPAQTHRPKHQYIRVAIHNKIIRIRQPGIAKTQIKHHAHADPPPLVCPNNIHPAHFRLNHADQENYQDALTAIPLRCASRCHVRIHCRHRLCW